MKRKYLITFFVAALGLLADQLAKTLVRKALSPMRIIGLVPGFLEFHFAENKGMAFGLAQEIAPAWRVPLFSLITLVAVGIIIHLLSQAPVRSWRLPAALGFILAGAFGNLTDRFRWGAVVDFIRVQLTSHYFWPTFNLADSFITIGILLLILDTFFSREEAKSESEVLEVARPETEAAASPTSSASGAPASEDGAGSP